MAVSTIETYIKKFINLLERAIARFEKIVKKFVKKPATYIVEFYKDKELTDFAVLKVGTTERSFNVREKELVKSYKNLFPSLKKIYFFEEEDDALIFESALRKFYKKKPNSKFIRNDRFENIRFDEKELEESEELQKQLKMLSLTIA